MPRPRGVCLVLLLAFSSCRAQPGRPDAAFALLGRINARLAECRMPLETDILSYQSTPDGAYEVRVAKGTYVATMARNPRDDAWIVLGDIAPDPCSDDELVATNELLEQINSQEDLGWTASLPDSVRGKTRSKIANDDVQRRAIVELSEEPTAGEARRLMGPSDIVERFTALQHYDARDRAPTETPCKAFRVRKQNACTACAFFAASTAAAARLCLQQGRGPANNVVFSVAQPLLCMTRNCKDGTDNGALAEWHVANGFTEEWCDPYALLDNATMPSCGAGACSRSGRKFSAVRFGEASGEDNMRAEILMNGPVVVSMTIYADFSLYKGGVYTPSAGANEIGQHAMVAVGWGVSTDGTPYWILQNSFGAGWGEQGFIRVRRGENVGGIETRLFSYISPQSPPNACATSCPDGSILLLDCTCRSDAAALAQGSCENGGVLAPQRDACICPFGFTGLRCQYGVTLERYAAVFTEGSAAFDVYFVPPSELSDRIYTLFLRLFPVDQPRTSAPAMLGTLVCGGDTPCGSGPNTITMQRGRWYQKSDGSGEPAPLPPGRYTLYIQIAGPLSDIVDAQPAAYYTVLPGYASTAEHQAAAAAENDPHASVKRAIALLTAEQDAMTERLNTATHVKKTISDVYGPATIVWPLRAGDTYFVNMPPISVCYRIPFDGTVASLKRLEFARPDGERIGTLTSRTLPENQDFPCESMEGTHVLASATDRAIVRMVDASTNIVLFQTPPFAVRNMVLSFGTITASTNSVTLQVNIMCAGKMAEIHRITDRIRLVDANQKMVAEQLLFTGKVSTSVPSRLARSFDLTKRSGGDTRTPLTLQLFANGDTTTPVASVTQNSKQSVKLAPNF